MDTRDMDVPQSRLSRGAFGAPPPHKRWIVNALVDTLLHLQRGDRLEVLGETARGLCAFPDSADFDLEKIARGLAVADAINRLVFRFHTSVPALARLVARFVPVRGAVRSLDDAPKDRPVILALMHFGPVHFVLTVLLPRLRGRTVYAVHAGGDTGHATARYLRALGTVPVLNDDAALLKLSRVMAEDPSCAIVLAFDHMGGRERRGRRSVRFLGRDIAVARGLAYLADMRDASVITAWAEGIPERPSVMVGGPYGVDRSLERNERQARLTQQLFERLEARIRAVPAEWTEWRNCAPEGPLPPTEAPALLDVGAMPRGRFA